MPNFIAQTNKVSCCSIERITREAKVDTIVLQTALTPVWIGVFATATLDLWAMILNRVLNIPVTNWSYVGRWVSGLPSVVYRDEPIAAAPAVPYERTLGWLTHYFTGITYGAAYLFLLGAASREPSAYSAIMFGVATVFAPWLILQPGLGMGFFASHTSRPSITRALNIVSHSIFGLGLYSGWRVLAL
jgi:hypothetical protein